MSPTAYEASGPRTNENPTRNLVFSDNWAVSPSRAQRAALRLHHVRHQHPSPALIGRDFVDATGLNLISQNLPEGSGSTYIDIAGYTRFGEGREEPLTQRDDPVRRQRDLDHAAAHTFKARRRHPPLQLDEPARSSPGADDFGVFRFRRQPRPAAPATRWPTSCSASRIDADQTASRAPTSTARPTTTAFFVQDEWRAEPLGHAEPGPALRPEPAVRGRRAEHHQLPARHAQRRRGGAERGLARSSPSPPSRPGWAPRASSPRPRPACPSRCATRTRTTSRRASAWPGGRSTTTGRCCASATASTPAASWAPSSTR